jgi:hypothetical protein
MVTPQADRRSQRRVEAAVRIRVRGQDKAGITYDDSTKAIEVSRRGLSFLTPHRLKASARLSVVIPGRGPARPGEGPSDFYTEAIVVRRVKGSDGFYRVGVRFIGATLPMYSAETSR